ncbi:hypothetical protein BASA83_010236 [Batrachochytrium salamandrivorans]|nr:hypothetical protein BASA83_010236 [Batrachochytrium salamandrivorans]
MSPRSTAAPKTRRSISHNGPRKTDNKTSQRLERQSKSNPLRIRQNYRHRRPDQPRPTAPPPPLSRADPRSQCCQYQHKRPAIRHIVRTPGLGHLRDLHHLIKFRFTVPGFDVIQHPATGPGRRGIALGIPSCFGGHEHGSAVGTMILAKDILGPPPTTVAERRLLVFGKPSTEFVHLTTHILFSSLETGTPTHTPSAHCPLVGPWSDCHASSLDRRSPGSAQSMVDVIRQSTTLCVMHQPAHSLPRHVWTDRQQWPTTLSFAHPSSRGSRTTPYSRAPTISRHHCLEATDRIATSNYWDVLPDGASDDTDTDTDIHQLTSTRSNCRLLSGATKRAILASNTARQAFIAATTHTNPDPVQCNTLRDEWSRLKAAATQLERVDGRKQWVKHADNLDRAVSDGRTDLVFAAARAMSGNSFRSAAVTPLYNSDGIVQYDPTSILRVMQGHYGSLAADTTDCCSPVADESTESTWRRWYTTAFYQAALYMPANTQEDVPPTPFARALLRVCGQVFASATIPRAWLCASIVSIDKKDGDPLNPGDKRGIALINVGLKLVCKVLQMRIERFVETNNLLSYEQAGFRKREECVGQVVSLVDHHSAPTECWAKHPCSIHRYPKGIRYSPRWCTVMEVAEHGIPSSYSCLSQALYTSSSARARAGSLLSDHSRYREGSDRDVLCLDYCSICSSTTSRWCRTHHSPWTIARHNPHPRTHVRRRCAVFADSEQSLLAASTAIEQWANQWEMQFGVAKCGIISFTGHLAPRLDNPLDIRLHGQLVSRVESYKYLGILIDSKLDHSAWLKQKRFALEHTISTLHPVLANHQLTVNYRSRIFSAVVMGKAYYGLELVGGNKSHLAPLQTTINKGIRLFTGARLSTAIGPLLVETGIGSLLTRSLVSRVRLLERSVTKKTPINAICSSTDNDVFTLNVQGQLVRSQRWFWSRRTKQLYRNRYWLTPQIRPKTVKQRHSFALMETLRTCGDSASLQKYVTRQFLDTSGFFKDPSFDQSRAHGTRYLMLARMDALWTARKAIQIGILVDTHPFSVDHCILCDQQLLSTSIAHLVVECEQVTGHHIQSGLVPAIQKSRLRLLGRSTRSGCGEYLDQRWLDGTVEHESMGTRHDNRALAARLADFLQTVHRTTPTQTRHSPIDISVLESANAVADNLSLRLSPPVTRSNRRLLSGTTKRAILASNTARQAFIAAATHTNPDPVQCNTLRDEWSRLKAAATQLERADGRKQWVKHADNLDRAVSDGRTDLVFSAARAMSGNSSRSAAVTPLYNSDGIVQYDPTSILRVMQGHYGSLAADTQVTRWTCNTGMIRQPIQVLLNTPPIRNSDILDQDFSWNQIAAALWQNESHGSTWRRWYNHCVLPSGTLYACQHPRRRPTNPIARALLRVCGQVFASATIPRAWLCASIVSIDKKDGDPLNPGDKRGIALINVGLKLVCKVLQMRIERFVETNNLLSYEQAGFRKREECVGQVVSLVDIIQRRQNAGINTHVLFIDIRKAFDTVPVGALLWKFQNMGFPRRTLAFLKHCTHPHLLELEQDHYYRTHSQYRGVSDRDVHCLDYYSICSSTTFSMVSHPSQSLDYRETPTPSEDSCTQTMWQSLLTLSKSLLAASTAIEQWANQWEMQFGVAKCGIISFTGHLAPRLDSPLDIRLHEQLVSRVESYKYLGVLIDSKLDHSAWLKQKRSALEHTISALHPVLANHQLTVNYRSRIFSAVVMGKAYYGLELVGGNKSHLAPLQTTINKGIRLFTGARLSTAIGPLLVETGIGHFSLAHWYHGTVGKIPALVLVSSDQTTIQEQILADTTDQTKDSQATTLVCIDGDSANKWGLCIAPKQEKPIQIGILVDTHPFSVDRCILCDQQLLSTSIAHLVVECEQVTDHRIQSGLVPAIQKSRLRLLGRALDPGVENVYTWLRGGVINGEADLDQRWLDGTVEHESMGTRHDNRALAARLADFLQVAYRQYQSTLWKYHRDRLVEVG